MKTWQIIVIIVGLYVSLVVGIIVKMYNKGIKGRHLMLSFLFPAINILSIVTRSFEILQVKGLKPTEKVRDIFYTYVVGIVHFPVLVGFASIRIAKLLEESKKKKHKRKSSSSLIANIFRSYDIYCDKYEGQLTEKYAN